METRAAVCTLDVGMAVDLSVQRRRVHAAAEFAARVREFSEELRAWRISVERPPTAVAAPLEHDVLRVLERQEEELAVAEEELRTQSEELEHAVTLAHAERRRYREVFQMAVDAMFVTDRAGVIVDSNAAAARLLALEPRFLHGRALAKLVADGDGRRVAEIAAEPRDQACDAMTTQMRRADGAPVIVTLACVAVEDGTRVLWRALPAAQTGADKPAAQRIAELERARRDADDVLAHERGARRRLEEENRMLRRFFAVVARDLAGPLNAVLSWTTTLRSEFHAREARARALAAIERSAQTQLAILERLFDLPRVMADEVRLDVTIIDAVALARAVVDRRANAAADGGIIIGFDDRTRGGASVCGDRRRLEQVLGHVVDNAIRFTSGGGTVNVTVERENAHVLTSVADSGRGLDPPQLRELAECGATGTGHYLVRRLTEVHGGTVDVKSDGSGKGTTVVVRLPAREPEALAPLVSAIGDALDGARVLLVEDDLDARDVVAAVLGHRGATVASARDGQEALALVRSFEPHVIVSTVGSSESDGFTLVRRLRHAAPDVGTISLGVASRAEALRGAGYAFDLQLPRPIDPGRLVDAVRDLLARDEAG